MNRRYLSSMAAALLGMASIAAQAAETQAARAPDSAANQAEYVFWLGERERNVARDLASRVLTEIDESSRDSRRLAGVYQRGGSVLKTRYTESSFVGAVRKYREGLGQPRERAFQAVRGGFKTLPNAADGQYAVVAHDVVFAASPVIYSEQLTLGRDPNSAQWTVVGYHLAVKPFYPY